MPEDEEKKQGMRYLYRCLAEIHSEQQIQMKSGIR